MCFLRWKYFWWLGEYDVILWEERLVIAPFLGWPFPAVPAIDDVLLPTPWHPLQFHVTDFCRDTMVAVNSKT